MAEPTKKSTAIEDTLTRITGQRRADVVRSNRCMAAPFGCGGEAVEFRDEASTREYRISGLCQSCQDGVFGAE